MYRNFNIELLDNYLDIILEPLFNEKYMENNLTTEILKIQDKKQLINKNMIKFPISINNIEISLTEKEKKEYIEYCEEKNREIKRKIKFINLIKGVG